MSPRYLLEIQYVLGTDLDTMEEQQGKAANKTEKLILFYWNRIGKNNKAIESVEQK